MLDKAAQGETVEITRDGRLVAKLVAVNEPRPKRDPEAIKRAIDEWIAYRNERQTSLGDLTIREAIDEGRR
jgi:antitoxin (DNA-binding transcriptional repressor) of toxin-antitoxin stability system